MRFISKLLGSPEDPEAGPTPDDRASPALPEHAVLVHLDLLNAEFGDATERQAIHALSAELETAIAASGAGQYDGDEFGGGNCTLYMYGPDADRLFAAVEPVLRASPLTRGGHAMKRYGPASEAHAREERVELRALEGD